MLLKRKPHTELEFLVHGSGFRVRSLESVFPSTANREPGTVNQAEKSSFPGFVLTGLVVKDSRGCILPVTLLAVVASLYGRT